MKSFVGLSIFVLAAEAARLNTVGKYSLHLLILFSLQLNSLKEKKALRIQLLKFSKPKRKRKSLPRP